MRQQTSPLVQFYQNVDPSLVGGVSFNFNLYDTALQHTRSSILYLEGMDRGSSTSGVPFLTVEF